MMRTNFLALITGAFGLQGLAAVAIHFGRLDPQIGGWIQGFCWAVLLFSPRILPRRAAG